MLKTSNLLIQRKKEKLEPTYSKEILKKYPQIFNNYSTKMNVRRLKSTFFLKMFLVLIVETLIVSSF